MINPRVPPEVGAALDHAVNAASDTLIVYYAGHGLLTPRGVLHLAVAETHPDQVGYTAVPMEWLRSALAESPARNRILILDCCYSGRAADAMTSITSAITASIDISGTYTVTSAPANSPSIAPPGLRFTAFTGELLKVLHEGIPGAGDLLSLRDIYMALVRNLQARSMPRPQHRGTGLADLIALGPNIADAGPVPGSKPSARQAPPEPQISALAANRHPSPRPGARSVDPETRQASGPEPSTQPDPYDRAARPAVPNPAPSPRSTVYHSPRSPAKIDLGGDSVPPPPKEVKYIILFAVLTLTGVILAPIIWNFVR